MRSDYNRMKRVLRKKRGQGASHAEWRHPSHGIEREVMHCGGRTPVLTGGRREERRGRRREEGGGERMEERREDRGGRREERGGRREERGGRRERSLLRHGVPERRSDERGGRCRVTPGFVSPPHSLPTKCATFTPKYDRLLAPCRGERKSLANG